VVAWLASGLEVRGHTAAPARSTGAIGVFGAVIGASTAALPIVGGLLVQQINWEAGVLVALLTRPATAEPGHG